MADLTVRITATENASGVLKKVGDAARQTADELKKIDDGDPWAELEAEAKQAAQAMKQAGDASAAAANDVEKVGDSAKRAGVDLDKMGMALTAIGAGLAYAGSLAMEHERMIVGLQQAYGDSAAEMIAFADTLASETGNLFNDDDILAGERFFATLRNNYGMTIAEIQEVARITADLAAASGVSYEDAANRVTAALRGEAEAAEYLGLTMNQAAIDRENLTLTMSNQEAAQFRLNALQEQSAVYMGTASAVAKTSAGDWAELTNQLKDAAQGVGDFIGPYGAMIGGLGTGAVGLAQFAGGFTALTGGIKAATAASRAFLVTPLGITVAAVAGTLAIASAAFLNHKQAAAEAAAEWEAAEASLVSLNDAINQMALTGDTIGSRASRQLATDIFGNQLTGADGWIDWYASELEKIKDYRADQPSWLDELVREDMIADGLDPNRVNDFGIARQRLIEELMPTGEDEKRLAEAFMKLLSLRGNPNIDQDALNQEMADLFANRNEAAGQGIDWLASEYEALYQAQISTLEGTEAVSLATWDYVDAINGATTATGDLSAMLPILTQHYARLAGEMLGDGGVAAITDDMDNLGNSVGEAAIQMALLAAEEGAIAAMFNAMGMGAAGGGIGALNAGLDAAIERAAELQVLADGLSGAGMAGASAIADVAIEKFERLREMILTVTGLDDQLSQFNATSMASGASELAQNFRDANAAASDLFRVIVGNTDAIKSQADATLNWATELINVRGELGLIDDLVSKGLLTGTSGVFDDGSQYAAAQNAYDSIAISTAQITDNLNAIQAIQSPLIAAMQADQAAYTAELLKQPAAVQLTALAWMDAATASRAFEIQALAASAATGDLGANGVVAMESYIDSIVRAEPATAALLEQLGLITNVVRDASGMVLSYDIDIAGAEGAQSEISLLTESIDRLTAAILGIPVAELTVEDNATPAIEDANTAFESYEGKVATGYVVGDNSNAMGVIDESTRALNALDGQTATVTILANNLASGAIAAAQAALNALDGRTATTYVRTVSSGVTYGPNERMGGVPGFEQGGVTFYGGEGNRPELARFANGGVGLVPHEGFWNVPPATRIVPNNGNDYGAGGGLSVQIDVHGNIYGIGDLAEQVSAQIVPAIAEATGTRFREQGVRW
jgi:hypothetical protein